MLTAADFAARPARQIELKRVRMDGSTQPRVRLDEEWVAELAAREKAALAEGGDLDDVHLVWDGETFWPGDGMHRLEAKLANRRKVVSARVVDGTKRDAVLYAVGCNYRHGLRLRPEDKRKSIRMLLADPEWAGWSNQEIARACHVSPGLVADEKRLTRHAESEGGARTYTTKHGTVATMRTARIGRRALDERDLPKLRDQCKRSARKLWRQLQDLAGLTGKPFALLLANHMLFAERAEAAAEAKEGSGALEPSEWGEGGPPG